MGIPVQSEMDFSRPDEHVLWALVNMGERIGAPLLLPEKFMRDFSRHLYRCGFRHHADLQDIWYKPPGEGDSIWHGTGGHWVEGPEPGVPPSFLSDDEVADKVIASLPPEIIERIRGGDSNGDDSGE